MFARSVDFTPGAARGSAPQVLVCRAGERHELIAPQGVSLWTALIGELAVVAPWGEIVIDPGQALLLETGERYRVAARGKRSLAVGLSALAADASIAERPPGGCHAVSESFSALLTRYVNSAAAGFAPELLARNDASAVKAELRLMAESCASLIARCPGRTPLARHRAFTRLKRVHDLVASRHLDHGTPLAQLSERAGMSRWHLQRVFVAVFGRSPHELQVAARLALARERITGSDAPIAEIAHKLGFLNRCAFARLFHGHFGITAAAMRRAARRPEPRHRRRPPVAVNDAVAGTAARVALEKAVASHGPSH
jgi:AraC family transcriptional activator of mar-sox-rob regulon